MLFTNAVVFFILWKDIRAGRNDFPIFYSNAQMVREGQASQLYNYDAENGFISRVSDVPRVRLNHVPYELLFFIPFTYGAICTGLRGVDIAMRGDAWWRDFAHGESSNQPVEFRIQVFDCSGVLPGAVLSNNRPGLDPAADYLRSLILVLEARQR
ncbi:MAG: hypothetical protein WB470_01950 [Candidatus Acidiferrales bacterium]